MSDNALIPAKKNELVRSSEINTSLIVAPVKYDRIDSNHYSFTFDMGDTIHIRMDESEQTADKSQFVDADFQEDIPETEQQFLALASACGVAMGTFSLLPLNSKVLETIEKWSEKDWHKSIVSIAQLVGYKKKDYKGSVQFLLNRAVSFTEQMESENDKGVIRRKLFELSSHPSWAGLVFSILTQFSGQTLSFDEKKGIRMNPLPEHYAIGNTITEKVIIGFLYWLFYLSVDAVLSKRQILDEIGLPKELLRAIKDFVNLPLMKAIPTSFEEAEKEYSLWLAKTLSESNQQDTSDSLFRRVLRFLNESDTEIKEESFPVILNECLTRGLYIVRKVFLLVREKEISSISDLKKIEQIELIPFGNRLISHMLLVSSGSFVAANISGAALKAIAKKKVGKREFAKALLTEINIIGIGRFVIACAEDSKYWRDDIKVVFEKVFHSKDSNGQAEVVIEDNDSDDAFDILTLDAIQAQALYSLEYCYILRDLEHTEKASDKESKKKWLTNWKLQILLGAGLTEDFFISDEELLYKGIRELFSEKSSWREFYLLAMEVALFQPYHPLGIEDDKEFKRLKPAYDYVTEEFVRGQNIIIQKEIDSIKKQFNRYEGLVSGSTRNKIIGFGAATAVTVATGGVALAFAPQIAVAIAGEAVLGLHGAALTSASLAFVGGGSLAVGGLGMAGGTAIITGGGALLGLASSGTASVAAILSSTSKEYWTRQGAKLLTYCNAILNERMDERTSVQKLYSRVSRTVNAAEQTLEDLKNEKNDLDGELVKKMDEYVKCIKRCEKELHSILELPS